MIRLTLLSFTLSFLTICFLLGWRLMITGLKTASEGYEDTEGFHSIDTQKEPVNLNVGSQLFTAFEESSLRFGQLPGSAKIHSNGTQLKRGIS